MADKRQILHLSHASCPTSPGQLDPSDCLGPPFFDITPNPAPEALRLYHFYEAKQEDGMPFLYPKACKECPLGNEMVLGALEKQRGRESPPEEAASRSF